MGKSPAIDNVGVGVVAHASAAVSVGGNTWNKWWSLDHFNRTGGLEPLLHLVIRVQGRAAFVLSHPAGVDAADRIAKRVRDFVVQIEIHRFVGKRVGLYVGIGLPTGVVVDEFLPGRTPTRRTPKSVHRRGIDGMALGHYVQAAPADKSHAAVIEAIVGPLVAGGALRGQSVPGVDVVWKQCRDEAVPVPEIMPAHLSVIVRKSFGIGLRFRKEQQTRVLVGISRQQYSLPRLEKPFAIAEIADARHASICIRLDARHVGIVEDRQILSLLRLGNRGDCGRAFSAQMATARTPVTVVHTPTSSLARWGVNGSRRRKGFPS